MGCRAYDPHFKLAPWRAVAGERYKMSYIKEDDEIKAFSLYDLLEDPFEMDNLVANPDYAQISQEMYGLLCKWVQKTDDRLFRMD